MDVFRDQVHLADILVAGKSDLANPDELYAFRAWAHTLYPAKVRVLEVSKGALDLNLLDINPQKMRVPLFPDAHDHDHDTDDHATSSLELQLEQAGPIGQKMRATAIEVAAGFSRMKMSSIVKA